MTNARFLLRAITSFWYTINTSTVGTLGYLQLHLPLIKTPCQLASELYDGPKCLLSEGPYQLCSVICLVSILNNESVTPRALQSNISSIKQHLNIKSMITISIE